MREALIISGRTCGWADLRHILLAQIGVAICGEASSETEALSFARTHQPSVIFSAAKMEGRTTLPLLTKLREICAYAVLIVIDFDVDWAILGAVLSLHIGGYFLWSEVSVDDLRQVLPAILDGRVMSGSWSAVAAKASPTQSATPTIAITEREKAILEGLAQCLTSQELAIKLSLGQRTVERTITDLNGKLDAKDRFTLGMRAAMLGLL